MGFLDKLKFDWWNSASAVAGLVEKWKPRGCKSEKDYELSLYEFLHEELGDTQITKQYARGRIRADLVVADKVIIELKTNLDSTAKYQRLAGQLAAYQEWDGRVLILLTGKTDINLHKELKAYTEKLNNTGFGTLLDEPKYFLLEK